MEVSMETIVCVCVAVGWWKTGGHCVKCEQVLWALALYCNEALGNITSFMCCSFLYHTCGGGSSYSVCVWDRKRGGRERSRKKGERKTTRSPPLFFFFFLFYTIQALKDFLSVFLPQLYFSLAAVTSKPSKRDADTRLIRGNDAYKINQDPISPHYSHLPARTFFFPRHWRH